MKTAQQPRTGMETMRESMTALAIREGSVEEVTFFRPGRIFRWQQEQSYDKEGTRCPLQRQLLLPASPCSSGHVLCAQAHTHRPFSRTNSSCSTYLAHLFSPPLRLTGKHRAASSSPAARDIPVHRCPVIHRTGPISGSREPFGLLMLQITPL